MEKEILNGKYVIYSDGQIWSVKRNKFLKPNVHHTGYTRVYINKKNIESIVLLLRPLYQTLIILLILIILMKLNRIIELKILSGVPIDIILYTLLVVNILV